MVLGLSVRTTIEGDGILADTKIASIKGNTIVLDKAPSNTVTGFTVSSPLHTGGSLNDVTFSSVVGGNGSALLSSAFGQASPDHVLDCYV